MSDGITPLRSVKYRCTDCGETHVRPRRFDGEPETLNDTCYAAHPLRNAGFTGYGETTELEPVDWEQERGDWG